MLELAIIADDLTGALDSAAPFAMRGIATHAALGLEGLEAALAARPRILAISSDSREIDAGSARARVAALVSALPDGTRIFKKVDSRLKGNISAELDALPHTRSLVVPAIPDFGRFVENGNVTGFGVDEPISVAGALGAHAANAIIPDTGSQADIEAALSEGADLYIGARGLAEALARRLCSDQEARPDYPLKPACFVIGSTDPITLAQIDALRAAQPELAYFPAPNGEVASDAQSDADIILIQATPGASKRSGEEVASALAASLDRLSPAQDGLLVLSGGATAQSILRHMGITSLEVLGEALPGLPVSRARNGLTVVSKSGGFGQSATLVDLVIPSSSGAR
ncbi:four-carbon acid sugar kinase family protein [Aquamicrobium zhengzhouense]|uniref:Four-carbon acid sugar kinase family protein n=1 Tax=Aquamicrobium zhengzhouense TaxID=2781738 RepID=A0ABS0SDB9_9HYPH|nr:four-carbon acid sugar kinase family protein [Aquamicrobium zhengzhouense]MBI1621262.1 four-carbon acid sugar kinase family protein [Aquamicrobium zhengzhouense]